jgi:hypothetical protein
MQLRSERVVLVLLCLRQSEGKDPENDLNEYVLLFSDATRDEILPLPPSEFRFTTLRTFGVASASSSSAILLCIEIFEAATVTKVSERPIRLLTFRCPMPMTIR